MFRSKIVVVSRLYNSDGHLRRVQAKERPTGTKDNQARLVRAASETAADKGVRYRESVSLLGTDGQGEAAAAQD